MVLTELLYQPKSAVRKWAKVLFVYVVHKGWHWERKGEKEEDLRMIFLYSGKYLPSTSTLQAHSAFPAAFSAMHLYSPPSSGMTFSMVSEHSVPNAKERPNEHHVAVH